MASFQKEENLEAVVSFQIEVNLEAVVNFQIAVNQGAVAILEVEEMIQLLEVLAEVVASFRIEAKQISEAVEVLRNKKQRTW